MPLAQILERPDRIAFLPRFRPVPGLQGCQHPLRARRVDAHGHKARQTGIDHMRNRGQFPDARHDPRWRHLGQEGPQFRVVRRVGRPDRVCHPHGHAVIQHPRDLTGAKMPHAAQIRDDRRSGGIGKSAQRRLDALRVAGPSEGQGEHGRIIAPLQDARVVHEAPEIGPGQRDGPCIVPHPVRDAGNQIGVFRERLVLHVRVSAPQDGGHAAGLDVADERAVRGIGQHPVLARQRRHGPDASGQIGL